MRSKLLGVIFKLDSFKVLDCISWELINCLTANLGLSISGGDGPRPVYSTK